MPSYRFNGPYARLYPAVFVDGRSLLAEPGDVVDFDGDPPGDGCWIPAADSPDSSRKGASPRPVPEPAPPAPAGGDGPVPDVSTEPGS